MNKQPKEQKNGQSFTRNKDKVEKRAFGSIDKNKMPPEALKVYM